MNQAISRYLGHYNITNTSDNLTSQNRKPALGYYSLLLSSFKCVSLRSHLYVAQLDGLLSRTPNLPELARTMASRKKILLKVCARHLVLQATGA